MVDAALHSWPALGALLIRDKLVSESDLKAVLVRQRISGEQSMSSRRLGELLIERGLIGPTQLARLLAEQWELPFVELDGWEVNLEAAMLLTEELARRLSALPIRHFPDGSVLVAVADPTSVHFSDDLRRALGAPVRFAVAAPEKIDAAITFVHQRPHALIERGSRETSSRDGVVMNVGPEDCDTAPAAERERTSTLDVERRVPSAWPPLGALLIRDGLISEEELEDALGRLLAEQYELPFVELTETAYERKAIAFLPDEIARRYSAVPIRVLPDGSLLVAVSDPTSALYADELRAAAGVPLHFAVAARDAVAAAIARAYEHTPGPLDDELGTGLRGT